VARTPQPGKGLVDEINRLRRLETRVQAVLGLIGNVDHSQGNGANAAKMRGELLNDIRGILTEALSS
jgi:hypothetical protein